MELYVLCLIVLSCQTVVILSAENDKRTVEIFFRMQELERKDLEREVEKTIWKNQMNNVLSKLDFVLAENEKLNKRINDIENENKELRIELMDMKMKTEMAMVMEDNTEFTIHTEQARQNTQQWKKPRSGFQRTHIHNAREVSDVKRIRRVENEADVAFYVALNDHLLHQGSNQNLAFERIITNVGNAYNSHSGDFHAPVAGTYVFSVSLMALGSHTTHYYIAMNGNEVGRLYVRGQESPNASSSTTVVLRLNAGDDVAIKNQDADEALHGASYSSFSGFLLQQDYSSSPGVIVG